MKLLLSIFLIGLTIIPAKGQEIIEWQEGIFLTLEDFKSKRSKIDGENIYIQPATRIEFSFSMSAYEFMFTKNFNPKVNNIFLPKSAVLIAPDEETVLNLLKLAQYRFDLNELYARKLRKMLFENKSTFSNVSFFEPYFNEVLAELDEKFMESTELTNFGDDHEAL